MEDLNLPVVAPEEEVKHVTQDIESEQPRNPNDTVADGLAKSYLVGWRLYGSVIGLFTGLSLSTLEVSIVSTALVPILNDLKSFSDSTWIVNSYLLTYTGFLIIWAQFSEVLGRKMFAIAAVSTFIVFSVACGVAQTATQLIILRACQGIGGAGMYNMAMVIVAEAVPASAFPKYVTVVSAVTVVAFGLGPLIGGALTSHTTWRWVFFINIPIGVFALVVDAISIPNYFPHHTKPQHDKTRAGKNLKNLDIVGGTLFLAFCVLFVTALQEADVHYAWDSALFIGFLVIAGLSFVVFVFWERFISLTIMDYTPILAWNFFTRRCSGLFATSFLVGAPFTCAVVQMPQRYQVLNGLSPFEAGARLIPFVVTVPVGAVLGAALSSKFKVRPTYPLCVGAILQLIAAINFALLPTDEKIHPSQYGFQVILGIGSGINNAIGTASVPHTVQKKDIAAALGANTQFRYLGGAVGLGIITSIINSHLRRSFMAELSPSQSSAVLQSTNVIASFPESVQRTVLQSFATGFRLQWKVLIALIAAQIPSAIMLW